MISAIVPMKPLHAAKQRLSGVLPDKQRHSLVHAMFCDVLKAVRSSSHIAGCFVVTADRGLAALAARQGAGHIPEGAPEGLNSAIAVAARQLQSISAGAMLILPGDVPLAGTAEIDQLIRSCADRACGIVPAKEGLGTNALLLRPPGLMATAFGTNSFERHLERARDAGADPLVCRFEGLGRDIDTAADLEFLLQKMTGRPEYEGLTCGNLRVQTEAMERS